VFSKHKTTIAPQKHILPSKEFLGAQSIKLEKNFVFGKIIKTIYGKGVKKKLVAQKKKLLKNWVHSIKRQEDALQSFLIIFLKAKFINY
jgi:hypothetical protein